MILFASIANLKLLSKANVWVADGTFKIVPRLFYQQYTVHGSVGDSKKVFPLVFGLMTGKSE
jgi:hypothetical protein